MKVEIHDPIEIHQILVEEFQKSSVNIVIKAKINECFSEAVLIGAVFQLAKSHPYLNARYYTEVKSGVYKYYYDELKEYNNNIELIDSADDELNVIMDSLSELRTYLFNHASGELFKVRVFRGQSNSVIELAVAHIVGEIPSIIMLMGDLLRNIDDISLGKSLSSKIKNKYYYSGSDFSWNECVYNDLKFDLNCNDDDDLVDSWLMPEATLKRYKLSIDDFNKVKNWLLINNINAKVSDVFYYVASQVLSKELMYPPDMWLILSYRNKSNREEVKDSIYNFAFFAPVSSSQFDSKNDKAWLEEFFEYRNNLITQNGVCQSRNFFYSLNKAMEGKDVEHGKNIMDSVVKFPNFAFNNFGRVDSYIGELNQFDLIDLEVQDGTPLQEIRYFSFNDEIYVNPTFFKKSNINVDCFWSSFINEIKSLIESD